MAVQPERGVRGDLAVRVYEEAEELRKFTLGYAGIPYRIATQGIRHAVALTAPDRRLEAKISLDSQLHTGSYVTRLVSVSEKPVDGETLGFGMERYIEPDGSMWIQGDSSQGAPWYPGDLDSTDLVGMLERFERLRAEGSSAEVNFPGISLPPELSISKVA